MWIGWTEKSPMTILLGVMAFLSLNVFYVWPLWCNLLCEGFINVSYFDLDLIENYIVPFVSLTLMLACDLFHELDETMVDCL